MERESLVKHKYIVLTEKHMFKNVSLIFLMWAICFNQIFADVRSDKSLHELSDAEKKLRELVQQLPALADKYHSDVEIQLGIAAIYDKYGAPKDPSKKSSYECLLDQEKKVFDQFEKVFAIDPNNRATLSISARRICWIFTGKRQFLLSYLARMIDNARGRNVEEILLDEEQGGDEFGQYFEKDDKGRVVIKNFDTANQQLRERLDQEVPAVLDAINKAQSKDSENAFYNYLRAHLYLELGEKNKALTEIEKGVAQKYMSSYPEEIARAIAMVLRKTDLSQAQRELIESGRSRFEEFLSWGIWERGLSDLGKDYESQGDFRSAEKIYRLTIKMAQQSQREQIYGPLGLDKAAQKRIKELRKKMPTSVEKILGENLLKAVKYVGILCLCGIVGVIIILLLKKKASNRGK